ncbi:SusC/RagA family TonB-linked outer membrane protein [Pedobacter frigoris]|uniref:SusC/RagA family TonB-linked outer membrane protein n=1 Tax=Pedobacter frigoris TaxID=2571272 RepID=UPI00292D4E8C|nr:SusC/RagA family TonB-linked outer membrane protein [Pedobacter frigoris]
MRLTTVILIATLMQVSASTFGQRVTLKENETPLKQVLQKVRTQTGYDFLYDTKLIKNAKKVSLNLNNVSLDQALNSLFESRDLTYTIKDKFIVIKEKEKTPSFLDLPKPAFVNVDARGKILDEGGKPLEGATVVLKGSNRTVKTDVKGEFVMANVPDDGVLVVRYIGYKQLEISLKDAVMPLEIKLNVATGELEEVKVSYSTGYQDIPKERATGSFVQIDNKLFNRAVGTNVLERILNITSGLRVEKGIGSETDITIRGYSTINANKQPLIVVDGFPYEETVTFGHDRNLINNPLFNINPNDVESITILRDAAAASIWGARSGNGVIVITTKRGKYNQPVNVSFNSSVNLIEKPRLNKMHVINPMDAVEIEKQQFTTGLYDIYDDVYPVYDFFPVQSPAVEIMLAARRKNSGLPGYNATTDPEVLAQLAILGSHDVRDDVSKYLIQTSINQQYALNLNGGTDKVKFYSSMGFDNNLPVERGNRDNRLTLNFNNTYRPIKNLELNTYLMYTKSKNINNGIGYNTFLPGAFGSLIAPYTRLADDDGNALHVSRRTSNAYRTTYIDTASYPQLLDWHYRPLHELENNDDVSNLYSTRFGGGIKYELIPGLSINLSSQYQKLLSNNNNYQNLSSYSTRDLINKFIQLEPSGTIGYPVPLGGILNYNNVEQTSWNVRGQLNFTKLWNKHQVAVIGGAEASETMVNGSSGRNYGYDQNTSLFFANMDYKTTFPVRASGGSAETVSSSSSKFGNLNRFTSYFANGAYTFDNKYTLTGSGRFDASNFFGSKANQRITPLWSSGLSWDISRENFYRLTWLPYLKLKATYGYNANLNNKATALPTARYTSATVGFHNENYLTLLTPPNPGLTWEKSRMVNFTLEYGIFGQRINGSFEYYTRKGINLIGIKQIDPTVGFNEYTGNYANMASKGFDFILNTLNLKGGLKWNSNLNISYNINKITAYEISEFNLNFMSNYFGGNSPVLNLPLYKIYSYPSAGLDPENGSPRGYVDGEVKSFQDVTLQAKPSDLVYHGSATPKVFGSLMNTFDYKNISLSVNISFKMGYYLRRQSIRYSDLFNNWGNAHADYYQRWQKPGDEMQTQVPSQPLNYDGRDGFYQLSDALVIKGDHVRLNDVRISYNLNKSEFRGIPFANATFYIYTNNLGVLWRENKEGIDPEYANNAMPPIQKSLALGLTVNF